MDEFDAIARLFMPLARGAGGAYDLKDDAAFLKNADGAGYVVTTDTIIENVHFRRADPMETVGRKLVRTNLSDLIAKAALPKFAFLNLSWPHDRSQAELAAFAAGLGDDLGNLCGNTILLGGDTTALDGPMVASLTLIGVPVGSRPVLRRGASPGDILCVTGEIGSSFVGLAQLDGSLTPVLDTELSAIYQVPQPPPLDFAPLVGRFAKASLDVSDGLIADARHLALVSGVEAVIDLDLVPLHRAVAAWRDSHIDPLAATLACATGGDDYQTLMAVRPGEVGALISAAADLGVRVTRLGVCRAGASVQCRWQGARVDVPATGGWRHQVG
jgi:thiamine-monophosphate kinase